MANWTFHAEDIITGLPLLSQGILMTLFLAITSFAAALVLGTLLGVMRGEGPGWFRLPATVYIEFMRGIPLILFLVFIHYGLLPLVFGGSNFLISSLLAFTLFESAYVGEIIRSGLRSVTTAERDAAKSLGLTAIQQFTLVILPLALRRMMPALTGQLISLLKDTSLASVVGVVELTRAGEIIYEQRYHDFEILLFQAVVYFTLCYALARLSRRFEASDPRMLASLSRHMP